jgi:hypothetical protein
LTPAIRLPSPAFLAPFPWFADSALEEGGFELSVPGGK